MKFYAVINIKTDIVILISKTDVRAAMHNPFLFIQRSAFIKTISCRSFISKYI